MASKDFKLTVKTVSKNFQKYTHAMEADVQTLIGSMLDVIESKIVALRKLLKLKLCIKNVRSIAGVECINNLEDFSLNPTYTFKDERKEGDSLEDLTSMVYEIDKNSLPAEDDGISEDPDRKSKLLNDIVDLESLCSALNRHNSKLCHTQQKEEADEEPRKALDKYIYMLLDAERRKEKTPQEISTQKIGDFASQPSEVVPDVHPSEDSVVYLGKTEYESILNILNMVLRSYKMQEEIARRNWTIEKAKTEPAICTSLNQENERKFFSESTCQQHKDNKTKNRKNYCL